MSKLIAIDAGHGYETPGKRTPIFDDGSDMKEHEFNESTAFYLQNELKRCGFDTILVAPEKTDTSLRVRVDRANNAEADIYISIHANASGNLWNEGVSGIESFIYLGEHESIKTYILAKFIQEELLRDTGRRNRGVKRRDDLYVLKNTIMSTVLVECGFMTNHEEAELLKNEDYRKKCAKAICEGICRYYKELYI